MKLSVRLVVLLGAAWLWAGCAATPDGGGESPLVSCHPSAPCLPVGQERDQEHSAEQRLGTMLDEVAALAQQGERGLREALTLYDAQLPTETGSTTLPLRRALIFATIGEQDDEAEVLALLDAHGERPGTPAAEAFLARLLAEQIRARQTLRASLMETREARDELSRQLEELKAIEQQIRDRTSTPADIQLEQQPERAP